MSSCSFPEGFVWGAATAAHQVEGGNSNNDCWAMEHAQPSLFHEPSGNAVDQFNRFADDLSLLAGLGLDAYRFSIEWARIEPREGRFSSDALAHYQHCIDACRRLQIKPVLTFHHFTQPLWLAKMGGIASPSFPKYFSRFCEHSAKALTGFEVACTINELNVPLLVRDALLARKDTEERRIRIEAAEQALGTPLSSVFLFADREALLDHGIAAHRLGRAAIKSVHPNVPVGVTLAVSDEQAEPGAENQRDRRRELLYRPFLEAARGDDFVGVQNYTRTICRADGSLAPVPRERRTVMGFEDYPQGLGSACAWVWNEIRTPILVTEHGWSGEDDNRRAEFIREGLDGLHSAIAAGADVRGYFYWSLLDNFEWLRGFKPKFGLVAVDRSTQRRTIKSSALALSEIARANSLQAAPRPSDHGAEPGEGSSAPVGI